MILFHYNLTFHVSYHYSCRANARNTNSRNANTTPPVLDQEIFNAEFKNAIQMLAQSMIKQNNQVHALVHSKSGLASKRYVTLLG